MADISVLGDLVLTVGGDLSPLQETLQQVPAVAQQAGDAINSALGSSLDASSASLLNLGSAIDNTSQSNKDFYNSIEDVNRAYAAQMQALVDAQQQLALVQQAYDTNQASAGQLADAAKQLQSAYNDLNPAIQQATEQTDALSNAMQLAGALVGAELLREFASAAVEAYSQLQGFQVSLTALAGGFQQANAQIAEMIKMGNQEALSIPSLLTARARMDSLGLSTENATKALQLAADSSAAMHKSLDTTVATIDRMVTSGAVMTRTLAGMGVSADKLAEAMGVSVSGIAKAFKDLDENTRLEKLQEAMANLAGQAQLHAATISGAFQRLENDIFLVMAELGKLIAPTVLDWVQTFEDLIAVVGSVMKAFESLHGTIGPLGVSVDTAKSSVVEFIVSAGGIVTALALAETAVKALNLSWETLSTTMRAVPYIAVAAAGAELVISIKNWLASLNDVNQSEQTLRTRLEGATEYLRQHGIQIDADRNSLTVWNTEVQAGFAELAKGGPTIEAHNAQLAQWEAHQKKLNDAVAAAKTHLADVKAAMDAGAPVQAEYAAATKALADAEKAADPIGYAEHQQAMTAALKSSAEQARELTKAATDTAVITGKLVDDVSGAGKNWDKFNEAVAAGKTDFQALEVLTKGMQSDIDEAKNRLGDMNAGEKMLYDQAVQVLQRYNDWKNAARDIDITLADMAKNANAHVKGILQASDDYRILKAVTDEIAQDLKIWNQQQQEINKWITQAGFSYKTNEQDLALIDQAIAQIATQTKNAVQSANALDPAWSRVIADAGVNLSQLEKIAAKMNDTNASLSAQQAIYEKILELKRQEGADYDAEFNKLSQINLQLAQQNTESQLLTAQVNILADAWNNMVKAFTDAFKGVSQGLSQAIVEGKSFGDTMHQVFTKLAEDILQTVIEGALKLMFKWLNDNFDLLGKLTSGFNKLFGPGGEVQAAEQAATDAVAKTGEAATKMASDVGNASSSAISNIQSVGSSALGIVSTIASVIGAIGSIMSAVELKHTNTLLSRIEESTRYAKRYLGEMGDGIYETMHDVKDILTQIEKDLQDINGSVKNIKSVGGGGPAGPAPIGVDANGNPIPAGQEGSAAAIIDAQQAALDPWRQAMDAIVAAMEPVKDSLGRVISGVENDTVRWGLATAALQDAVSGDMDGAIQALRSAGLSMAQATAVLEQTGFSYLDTVGRAATSIDTSLANIATGAGVMAQAATVTAAATMQVAASMGIAPLLPAVTSQTVPNIPVTNFAAPGATPFAPTFGSGTPTGLASQYNSAPSITVTVHAGVVAGQNGMQQLAQMVGDKIVDGFRRAGMRY